MSFFRRQLAILLVISYLFGSGCDSTTKPESPRVTLSQGKRALAAGQFERASEIAQQLLEKRGDSVPALMLAAESATKLEDYTQAIEYYAQIPESKTGDAAVAKWAIGEIYFHLGEASKELAYLREALKLNPNYLYAHSRLSTSLDVLGLRWDSRKHLLALLKAGEISVPNLLFLGNHRKETYAQDELERYLKANPDDRLPLLAKAKHSRSEGKLTEAKELLESLLTQRPQLVEAHIQLGRILLQEGTFQNKQQFDSWADALPNEAVSHPDTWYLRGRYHQPSDKQLAVQLYSKAISLDPNHQPALQSLSQVAAQTSLTQISQLAAERAENIQLLNLKLQQLYQDRQNLEHVQRVAELTFELGRFWEAFAWCMVAKDLASQTGVQANWVNELLPRISAEGQLTSSTPQTMQTAVPLLAALKEFIPTNASGSEDSDKRLANEIDEPAPATSPPKSAFATNVRYADVAAQLGVNFSYSNGQQKREAGRLMHQFTGGGVGTCDFDRDGWCDLYLVQGQSKDADIQIADQAFRNIDGQRLSNATSSMRLEATEFGQGVAIGDINADGFNDIFLATTTSNQLWLNQGDGTFLRGDSLLPENHDVDTAWTTSALIGDINGDGLADIYEANYVQGDNIFTRRCQVEGKPSVCSPLAFEPAHDQIYFSSALGRFQANEKSDELLGNSLGISLFRMPAQELPFLFIAVDQQANLLLTSQQRGSADTPENEALLRGVAYDEDGNAQACMGIAIADVTGDGQVDIHVTNFYDEYNTLYVQEDGIFRDRTAVLGLVTDTLPMLGFGVQATDAQRDGLTDYFVLNGHIDDQTHTGAPEKMPAQLFLQTPSGFSAYQRAGQFFETPALGRALAKWDFNRDGAEDFVATDLEGPVSILRNESAQQNSLIRLRFVGTVSERSAVTTIATLNAIAGSGDNFSDTKQLIGGGGYLASNDLYVEYAVPADLSSISLAVDWPSGLTEEFSGLLTDREYVIIEQGKKHQLNTFSSP